MIYICADKLFDPDVCRGYAAMIAERPLPQAPNFTLSSTPRRKVVRLTDRERETRRVLLRLANQMERRCPS